MISSWTIGLIFLAGMGADVDSVTLVEQIDRRIDEQIARQMITVAEPADDAQFLRRLTLDLIGRIPTEAEVRAFLAKSDSDKRSQQIDQFLASEEHADHFARTWRSLLLPEAETDAQLDYLRPGLEAWLRERRTRNVPFDALVRELIATPIAGPEGKPEMVLRDLQQPNALGFFAAKEAKPENLAASTTRLFLGIRIECAQCHDHPFGQWTRHQFWNQAAFFSGLERRGRGAFAPLVEVPNRNDILIAETDQTVPALFLDGQSPNVTGDQSSRAALARWLTSSENPQFAKATVNRVWGQLLGVGLVDPIDDFHESNPPSHPELLEELASEFVDSGYDLTFLMQSICRTKVYQRGSRRTDSSQDDPHSFARGAIKQLSAEQFVDSLWLSLGTPRGDRNRQVGRDRDPKRQRFLEMFAGSEVLRDPLTSIQQALTLSNGDFVNSAVVDLQSPTLKAIVDRQEACAEEKIDSLYLATLSRFPSETEREQLLEYVSTRGPEEQPQRYGDIFWMLLNSAEYRCNH